MKFLLKALLLIILTVSKSKLIGQDAVSYSVFSKLVSNFLIHLQNELVYEASSGGRLIPLPPLQRESTATTNTAVTCLDCMQPNQQDDQAIPGLPNEIAVYILNLTDLATQRAFAITSTKGKALVERFRNFKQLSTDQINQVYLSSGELKPPFVYVQKLIITSGKIPLNAGQIKLISKYFPKLIELILIDSKMNNKGFAALAHTPLAHLLKNLKIKGTSINAHLQAHKTASKNFTKEALDKFTGLTSLTITDNQSGEDIWSKLESIANSVLAQNLESLTMSNTRNLSTVTKAVLNKFTKLTYLDVSKNEHFGVSILKRLENSKLAKQLIHLNLSKTGLSEYFDAEVLDNFINLQSLNLSHNPLDLRFILEEILSSKVAKGLKKLNLANLTRISSRNNYPKPIPEKYIVFAWPPGIYDTTQMSNLESLKHKKKTILPDSSQMSKLENLEELDLSNNSAIANRELEIIANSSLAHTLTSLTIKGTSITQRKWNELQPKFISLKKAVTNWPLN